MSAVLASAPRSDLRTASRWFGALILPIGPAAIALLRYFLPYDTVDDPATITSKMLAHPGRASLVLWLASEECSFSTGAVFDVSGGRATY